MGFLLLDFVNNDVIQRIERTQRNAEEAKIRQERRQRALEELHKDD